MRNSRKSWLLGACAAVTLAAFTGCESPRPRDERSAGRVTDDKAINTEVRNALDQEPVYKFDGVEVKTFAGVVQLSGFVNIDEQRRRAEQIASQVPGVSQVINGIAIKPQPLMPTGHAPRVYSSPSPATSSDAKQGGEME